MTPQACNEAGNCLAAQESSGSARALMVAGIIMLRPFASIEIVKPLPSEARHRLPSNKKIFFTSRGGGQVPSTTTPQT
jgi:hypothetical protein